MTAICSAVTWPVAAVLIAALVAGTVLVVAMTWLSTVPAAPDKPRVRK